MNPTDPGSLPEGQSGDPSGPGPVPQPKPWHKPPNQENQTTEDGTVIADGGGLVDAGVEGASLGADIVGGAADAAGGALEAVGDAAGGLLEGAGSALDTVGGCADSCSGCSLAMLILLSAAASTAMAIFR